MAAKKKPIRVAPKRATTKRRGKKRLNLLIDADLKDFAKAYADRHHKTITMLVTDYFQELQDSEFRVEQV